MGLSVKIGTFSTTTNVATTQVAVTGVGFQPSFVLFFATPPITAAGLSAANAQNALCVGFAVSSTKRGYTAITDKDSPTTTTTSRAFGSDGCFGRNDSTSGGAATCRMDFVSMDADGFTLVIDVAFAASALISYKAFGGSDITGVDAGAKTCSTGTGTQTVSGLAFAPTGCLLLSSTPVAANPSIGAGGVLGVGFASAAAQGCMATRSKTAEATTSDSGTIITTTRVSFGINSASDTLVGEYAHTGFTADGFTLDKTVDATNATILLWLAWAGPQIKVGTTATRTDTNNTAVTGVGFQPSAVMLLAGNATATETAMSAHAKPCIGWATSSTERAAGTLLSEDGLAMAGTIDVQSGIATDRCLIKRNRTAANTFAAATEMDLVSMDADGFTLDSVIADSQATMILYLALGATATTAKIDTLQTAFPGSSLPSPFVDGSDGGSATVASNRLALSSGDAASEQGSVETDPTVYDLDESAIYLSVTPSLLADFKISVRDAGDNGYEIEVGVAGDWIVRAIDADFPTDVFSVAYNATTMKWWRIREASGVLHFETAPASGNSPGSFTDQYSENTDGIAAFDPTAVIVALANSYVATANSISYVEAINTAAVGGFRDRGLLRGLNRGLAA